MPPYYCKYNYFVTVFVVNCCFQVSPHSLLPDTICGECYDNVINFYAFIKNCLQNVIILETQYDITESCLKSKRRYEKSCNTEKLSKQEKNTQTIDYLDLLLKEHEQFQYNFPPIKLKKLVDYDIDSDTNSESDGFSSRSKLFDNFLSTKNNFGRKYFDDPENYLISEITQRKNLKRKNPDVIQSSLPKICKLDTSSRRKSKQPKKIEVATVVPEHSDLTLGTVENNTNHAEMGILPQVCLLCDKQFSGPSMLASHVFETHGIDMAHIVTLANDANIEKKKKLPNLVKISDLRRNEVLGDKCFIFYNSMSVILYFSR